MRHRLLILLAVTALALVATGCSSPPDGSWTLVSFANPEVEGSVPLPRPVTLAIEGDVASGSSGCNTYSGKVEVAGGLLRFSSVAVTAMYCDNQAVMATEARYLEVLVAHDWRFTTDGGDLRLEADDDTRLVLEFGTG